MTGITLNGVVLLGQALDWNGMDGEWSFLTALPTLAAVAWHYGMVDKKNSLDPQIERARAFAASEYLKVLYQGDSAPLADKARVAKELSALTGLSQDFILRKNLRVSPHEFASELLASKNLQVGLYDARYTLPLRSSGDEALVDDPAAQYRPAFVAANDEYLRKNLRVATDRPYKALEFRSINSRWNWGLGPAIPPRGSFAADLAVAMRRNPSLNVLVGEGIFDLVTTMGSADYMINHAGINRARVFVKRYASGHMPYIGDANRKQLAKDIRDFIKAQSRPPR